MQASLRSRIDAVTALTLFLILSFCIPSPLVIKAIGASGTPANLIGIAFLAWWALSKLGSGQGVDRGRQPVRIALLLVILSVLASLVPLFTRPFLVEEGLGAERGLLNLAALSGVALLAADGITSLERVHTLLHRLVHGVSFVAALGLIQFLTGYNPAQSLTIPGLTRNEVLQDQGRSLFLRVQSTTLHPIELGSLLGLTLPLAVIYAFRAKGRRSRQIAWVEVALIGAVLPMALTRTGIVAATIGMLAIAVDWTWRRRGRALVVLVVSVGALRAAIPGLIGTLVALFTKINQDDSTTARTQRYQIAGHYFLQHPWFGRGFNTLYPATKQIFDNWYLYTATETGAVGLLALFLLFMIMMFTARGARLRSTDPQTREISQALAGTAVAMMIMFATADMMSYTMLMGVFFMLLGVAGAMWRLTGGQTGGVPARGRKPERVAAPRAGRREFVGSASS